MSELLVLRGLPGSGKSTYAVSLSKNGYVRLSRDDMRLAMFGKYTGLTFTQENIITDIERREAKELLKAGHDVVIDAMNIRPRYVRDWRKLALSVGAQFSVREFDTDLETCIARDAIRERTVGAEVIRDMARKFMPKGKFIPVGDEPEDIVPDTYIPVSGTPKAVLVDIDGTVASMKGVRNPHDYHLVSNDKPVRVIVDLVKMIRSNGFKIVFLSGRTDRCRDDTQRWLSRHIGHKHSEPLFMRKDGDMRKDSIVKRELFDEYVRNQYDVQFVLDDRDQVVKGWRALGLVCLQVADGSF